MQATDEWAVQWYILINRSITQRVLRMLVMEKNRHE